MIHRLRTPPGMSQHPLANTWRSMIYRCYYPRSPKFKEYGARGISICPEWLEEEPVGQGFRNFLQDMGERPAGRSLERRNNNGPYSKANCYWATRRDQVLNKRYKKDGVTYEIETPRPRFRAYIVLLPGDQVLLDDRGKPFVTKDLIEAKHMAMKFHGHQTELKAFLNSR